MQINLRRGNLKTNRRSVIAEVPLKTALATLLTVFFLSSAFSQVTSYAEYGLYDTDILPPSFFKANREKLQTPKTPISDDFWFDYRVV